MNEINCESNDGGIVCEAEKGNIYTAWSGEYSSHVRTEMWCPQGTDLEQVADNVNNDLSHKESKQEQVVNGFKEEGCKEISIKDSGDSVGMTYISKGASALIDEGDT